MSTINTDILVIGAGSGGLSVAAGASRMGARVVLLEGGKMGGDCLNHGCVPSKALIASARAAHLMTQAARFGLADSSPQVDYAAVQNRVADIVSEIAPNDSQERYEGFGVRVIREYGRFVSEREVKAGRFRILARRVVVATGSSPLVPSIPGLDAVPYLTNETLWSLRTLPGHLVVLGGGPIGMELAQAHRRLGARVTVIEAATVLNREDPELVARVVRQVRKEGVELIENARAKRVSDEGGAITVETEAGGRVTGSHLLVALGRVPCICGLDLAAAGIDADETGIKVDTGLRSSNRRVYAIGDVAGLGQFTHLAGHHATVVLRSALFGFPAKASQHIPRAIYVDPELAQVGLTEMNARGIHGNRVDVIRLDLSHNDRAITDRRASGLMKLMVRKGRPIGVSVVGPQAGELVAMWSLVLANGIKLTRVAATVVPYPTLMEANRRIAGEYLAPNLCDSSIVRRVVRFVQDWLP